MIFDLAQSKFFEYGSHALCIKLKMIRQTAFQLLVILRIFADAHKEPQMFL